ncbi:hypothetical protein DPEC_G00342210 [Dallia pectoralis]|uniref:Uncharacterized protein n=1 Tax=Dallia pectoralis TaxID=75939 RepID=A0ACC2F5N7_DALPE|nr:hypothetical protein DPEC_G00342210 [Dallia pectoralis]
MDVCLRLQQTHAARTSSSWIHLVLLYSIVTMWSAVEGWSYHYSNHTMNWDAARTWCTEHYTDMVAIQNREEIDHLNSFLPKKQKYYWIGIRKVANVWTWVGTKKNLTSEAENWARGEPNNVGNNEDCVEMYIQRDVDAGKWNDESCKKQKMALCYRTSCQNEPCHHGECRETINSHTCECFPGFYGDKCEHAVSCPSLQSPQDGAITCAEGFTYGRNCTFSCSEGYRLQGASKMTCTSAAEWSDKIPQCKAIQCLEPEKRVNLLMECSHSPNALWLNSTCTFSCAAGFHLQGASNTKCTEMGQWSTDMPNCTAIQCPSPGVLQGGQVRCEDLSHSWGSICTFSCDEGFNHQGDSSMMCSGSGEWSTDIPTCAAIQCPSPGVLQGGQVRCEDLSNSWGSICTFSCDEGFNHQGDSSMRCSGSGEWSTDIPTCAAVSCPSLQSPQDGAITCAEGFTYGRSCSFSCSEGYRLLGASKVTCTSAAEWSDKIPHCKAIQCLEPEKRVNLLMECSHSPNALWLNSTCTFSCAAGFHLQGASNTKCTEMGQWSTDMPNCTAIQCPSPGVLQGGQLSSAHLLEFYKEARSDVRTSPIPGVQSAPSAVMRASTTRGLKHEMFWIRGVEHRYPNLCSCPSLQSPQDGAITCAEGFTYGRSCSFSCSEGYRLLGASKVTCTSAAEWSDKIPHCKAIQCLEPEKRVNLLMECSHSPNALWLNSTCTFSCAAGFHLQGASNTKCTEMGQWSTDMPNCTAIQCPSPGVLQGGQVRCEDLSHSWGSICTFSCDEGFNHQGDSSMMCSGSGEWSTDIPTCAVVRCPVFLAPVNGQMSCFHKSLENAYGTECSFVCDRDYVLHGHEVIICDRYGNWTGEVPGCQASSEALLSPTTTGLAAAGAASLPGISLAAWLLKRLRQKAKKFDVNTVSDMEETPETYRSSIDSLI